MPGAQRGEKKPGTVEWVEAKFETVNGSIAAVEKQLPDIKDIALRARKKADEAQKTADEPHACAKEDVLRTLNREVASWSKWWRGTMITVITAIVIGITVMAGWLYSHKLQGEKIENLDKNMSKVTKDVEDLGESQEQMKESLERDREQNDKKEEKRLGKIKQIFETVLSEKEKKGKKRKH